MSEDIIAILNNLNYIEKVYYELKTLLSKKECNLEINENEINILKNKLKIYYYYIPYDLSVINNNNNYEDIKEKLGKYYNKIPKIIVL